MSMRHTFKQPVTTNIRAPQPNPLDTSTPMQNTTQARLSADDETERQTTPEATLTHIDLEPDTEPTADEETSQSTLSGTTFHTTHRTSKMGDGDESQSWQIEQAQRGPSHTEH